VPRCAAVTISVAVAAAVLGVAAGPAAARPPNVVVIEADDQTAADIAAMPRTRALIGNRGVSFERSVVSLSQCCPSRATLLTGRYAHTHRVLSTVGPSGGAQALDDREHLGAWLRRAGTTRRWSASTSTASTEEGG
jgi:N-acetylglucosamine-6-sulfatase